MIKKNFSYKKLYYRNNFKDSLKNSDLVFILNDHNFFKKLKKDDYEKFLKRDSLIYDCWNLYNYKFNKIKYLSFGNILNN